MNLPAANLNEIEARMLSLPQANCATFHYFSNGIYIRELHMSVGTLAIGHEHIFSHLNIFIKGKLLLMQPDGAHKELIAPKTFVSPPGRKVVYVLEDVIWQNVYPNPDNETDIEVLEDRFVKKSDNWLRLATETGLLDEIKNSELRYGVQL